jgi:hypothetical protein
VGQTGDEKRKKNNEAGWAACSWKLGFGQWPIFVIGKTFPFLQTLFK